MNKIIFANNPLDRSSNLRSDKEWQSSSISDKNTCFVLFNSGKPLIRVSREPGKNSKIYLAHFNKVEKYLDKSYTVFLGRLETKIITQLIRVAKKRLFRSLNLMRVNSLT